MLNETIDGAHYWAGCSEGELRIKVCDQCGHAMFYPRPYCPRCSSDDLTWTVSSGRGFVHAMTVVHRAPNRDWRDRVPYVLALVDLDEGPRLMTVISDSPDNVRIGAPVSVKFEDLGTGGVVPIFETVAPAPHD